MSSPVTYTVTVRTLCEFAAKSGDLDLRFTPSPTAQQGIDGHRTVASRRHPGHRREVPVEGCHRHLRVRGRVDGFDPTRALVEEVKTYKGDLARMPDNHRALHWAQAKVYAWLLCEQESLPSVDVALVYFDVGAQREAAPLVERYDADALRAFFEDLCERFIAWADRELAHRASRDAALRELGFPHRTFRAGQRELAKQVWHAATRGRALLAQAPTGIGKTVATLFPALKAMARERIDKVFWLTAKGSGATPALAALDTLGRGRLRVVELVARDKACVHPDRDCHGASCPLAAGFYDRLPAARLAATATDVATNDALRAVAREHDVCPYYLAQEVVRWADVVVADYNYYFDTSALLHAMTVEHEWRVVALIDEAHNLVERGRAMYSATLSTAAIDAARAFAPAELRKPLERVRRAWSRVVRDQESPYVVHAVLPAALLSALADAVDAIGALHDDGASRLGAEIESFHLAALHFVRLAEDFDTHSLFDATLEPPNGVREKRHRTSTLCIRNVVPASFLSPRFARLHGAVLFSGTLAPQRFYADMLGLPGDAGWLAVDSPFDAAQLRVRAVADVSTRYAHRTRSLATVATLIAREYAERPGNYLAFFGSFDYLAQVAETFARLHPDVPTWAQERAMDASAREAFLDRFEADGRGVGFAVLGGSFGEGIDLVGPRLVGVLVATLGMPQVNAVNEEMRRRLDARFGAGFDYAYLYPGLRRVVQAAGRVLRGPDDRGSVTLIDDRYARSDVRALLPAWWAIERVRAHPGTGGP